MARGQAESGLSFAAPLQITMSTVSADAGLFYDSLTVPRRGDRALWLAFAISLLLHAAAVALLPGLRVPEPRHSVLSIELQPAPRPEVEKRTVPRKVPARMLETPFKRQELEPSAFPAPLPEPIKTDPRPDVVAATPRVEPSIERRPSVADPVPVIRAEPRPLPDVQPLPQPRVERAPVAPAPSRPEPIVEQRAEVRPEPRMETRVEPRLQAIEPRPTVKPEQRVERAQVMPEPRPEPILERRAEVRPEPRSETRVEPRLQAVDPHPSVKPEQRVEPVATPRSEPVLQRQQASAAPTPPRLDTAPALPKVDAAPAVARVERQPEVKAEPRVEPVLAARQGPVVEPARPDQVAPRAELPAERKPQPIAAPQPEVRLGAPPPVQIPRAQPRQELSRNDIQAAVPLPQAVPQQSVERHAAPQVTAPAEHPPEIRRPVVQARAEPPVPKRNKAEEDAAIQRFAKLVSKQFDVSERDYPRLARDRRWQGTTELLLNFQADGKLGEVRVATSSGYEILDRRALELLNRMKLPALPPEIQARAFAVRVPVKFALRE